MQSSFELSTATQTLSVFDNLSEESSCCLPNIHFDLVG